MSLSIKEAISDFTKLDGSLRQDVAARVQAHLNNYFAWTNEIVRETWYPIANAVTLDIESDGIKNVVPILVESRVRGYISRFPELQEMMSKCTDMNLFERGFCERSAAVMTELSPLFSEYLVKPMSQTQFERTVYQEAKREGATVNSRVGIAAPIFG